MIAPYSVIGQFGSRHEAKGDLVTVDDRVKDLTPLDHRSVLAQTLTVPPVSGEVARLRRPGGHSIITLPEGRRDRPSSARLRSVLDADRLDIASDVS
jgi:hypothetical protein